MSVINYQSSFRRIYELVSPDFYVIIRRAFGDKVYFEGFLKELPYDHECMNLIVIEVSGGADYYKGQTLKLCKGHPIDYLDIALGDLVVNDCIS